MRRGTIHRWAFARVSVPYIYPAQRRKTIDVPRKYLFTFPPGGFATSAAAPRIGEGDEVEDMLLEPKGKFDLHTAGPRLNRAAMEHREAWGAPPRDIAPRIRSGNRGRRPLPPGIIGNTARNMRYQIPIDDVPNCPNVNESAVKGLTSRPIFIP